MILADTSLVVAAVERGHEEARRLLQGLPSRSVRSMVVLGELKSGVRTATDDEDRRRRQRTLRYYRLVTAPRLSVALEPLTELFAEVTATASSEGRKVGQNDRWILAEAFHHRVPVWTADLAMHELAVSMRGEKSSELISD